MNSPRVLIYWLNNKVNNILLMWQLGFFFQICFLNNDSIEEQCLRGFPLKKKKKNR